MLILGALLMKKYFDIPPWNSRPNRQMWDTYLPGAIEESQLSLISPAGATSFARGHLRRFPEIGAKRVNLTNCWSIPLRCRAADGMQSGRTADLGLPSARPLISMACSFTRATHER
jgi:hypothetical protein